MADPTEEVRTIFLTGLPKDVKERELRNLLRWLPGFEACNLSMKGDQPMGFALFQTVPLANSAKNVLQDYLFDDGPTATLKVFMAKKNLFVKKEIGSGHGAIYDSDPSKRARITGEYEMASHFGTQAPHNTSLYGPPNPAAPSYISSGYAPSNSVPYPTSSYLPSQQYEVLPQVSTYPAPYPTYSSADISHAPHSSSRKQTKALGSKGDNPPCNTLYIANLDANVQDYELQNLFQSYPGFCQLKVMKQASDTKCFVQFENIANASHAHEQLQGVIFPASSTRGPLLVQYSKNPFGKKQGSATAEAIKEEEVRQERGEEDASADNADHREVGTEGANLAI